MTRETPSANVLTGVGALENPYVAAMAKPMKMNAKRGKSPARRNWVFLLSVEHVVSAQNRTKSVEPLR